MSDTYLTPEELAERWRVNVKTLANWRSNKTGPQYLKLGGRRNTRVMYPIAAVYAYEAKHMRGEEA